MVFSNQKELHEKSKLTAEECIYWRQLASDYIEELEAKESEQQIPFKQWEYIQIITEDIEYEKKVLRKIKGKINELERIVFCGHISTQEPNKESQKISLSRYSPYPGTRISRVPLSEKYIPWEALYIDYEPIAYSKPANDFPEDIQSYVDEDIIQLKEMNTRDPSLKLKFPNYQWNSQQINSKGLSVNRISWQINDNGLSLYYKLEDNFLPLNPFGRTGLRGRGGLPRWGPNHFICLVITRWQRSAPNEPKTRNLELMVEYLNISDQICLPEVSLK